LSSLSKRAAESRVPIINDKNWYQAPDSTFHLRFAMNGWHSERDTLLEARNAIATALPV
jgi:hypothetical protein